RPGPVPGRSASACPTRRGRSTTISDTRSAWRTSVRGTARPASTCSAGRSRSMPGPPPGRSTTQRPRSSSCADAADVLVIARHEPRADASALPRRRREVELLDRVLELDPGVQALGLEGGQLGADAVALAGELVELAGPLLALGGGRRVLGDGLDVGPQLVRALIELVAALDQAGDLFLEAGQLAAQVDDRREGLA